MSSYWPIIQFAISGGEPQYQVEFTDFYGGSPQYRILRFSFVEGYEYDGHEWIRFLVGMSTNGTKEFYVSLEGSLMFENGLSAEEILEDHPIELVDSGITRIIDSDYLDGWVDLLVFGSIHHVVIDDIKYTKGY